MRKPNLLTGLTAFAAGLTASTAVLAQEAAGLEIVGSPSDRGTGFQPAASSLAVDQQWLDGVLLYLCIGVVALVLALLAVVILRYNARANPKPASFTHNTPLEITWTLIPVVILVVLAVFSLPVLFKQQEIPEAEVTIKVTGNQWFWSYEYPDAGLSFDSYMIGHPATLGEEDAGAVPYVLDAAMEKRLERSGFSRDEWLLATDTSVVVPVGKRVVMLVTGADVIHSWTIPAFAVKQDAVPGRTARLWFQADREGVFFGQCSELCGKDHAYMPITVKVVSQEVYDQWLAASVAAGGYTEPAVRIAAAE